MNATSTPPSDGLSAAERAAIKDRAKELKAPRSGKKNGEADMMEKIAAMDPAEQVMAKRLHELVTEHAPELAPKTWYGMPAWARQGKVVCFFQAASKFGSRYSTLGFDENANLDDGDWWPTAFALITLSPAVEKQIIALIKKAA
jgi:uncharacterized protein YdhG (YjbR/CyaY superfamily)